MNKQTIAMKIMLYNIKANRLRTHSVLLDGVSLDRRTLQNERERLVLIVLNQFQCDINNLITNPELRKWVDLDLNTILEGLMVKGEKDAFGKMV